MGEAALDNKFVLDACCGGRMFWYEKTNPSVLFMDIRTLEKGAFKNGWNPNFAISPDLVADFRDMPLPDRKFKLVVWDPPHLYNGSMKSVMNTKYGILDKQTWQADLTRGFNECWRVLDTYGVLVFKWNEANIKLSEVLALFPQQPLFGDFTGKTGKTRWMTFMKIPS